MSFEVIRDFQYRAMRRLLFSSGHIQGLAELALPEFVERVVWEAARALETDFVTDRFRRVVEDVVVEAPIRGRSGTILIAILVAHQSQSDVAMRLRLLRSQCAQWAAVWEALGESGVSPRERRLKVSVPLVVHTGKTPWELGELGDLFDVPPGLEKYVPVAPVELFDLSRVEAERLLAHPSTFGPLLSLFKAQYQGRSAFRESFRSELQAIARHAKSAENRLRAIWYALHFGFHRRITLNQYKLRVRARRMKAAWSLRYLESLIKPIFWNQRTSGV